jgi:hypothetical protein
LKRLATFVLALLAARGATTGLAGPDPSLLTAVLHDHVRDGLVDYAAVGADQRLPRFLGQVAATDPEQVPAGRDRLAFWLNAYNAYTLQLIVERHPRRSITEIRAAPARGSAQGAEVWDLPFAVVGGKKYSLNQIEHEFIRGQFRDPRAHFALNCASGSCPALRPEAYDGPALDRQLDEQGRLFLGDPSRNRFDLATRTAYLSSIFKWYRDDFGTGDQGMLLAAAAFAPEKVRRSVAADPGAWRVQYLEYDWSLNARP